tara:strand:- start:268 stop:501 length:234 start_codon:yes stop_codon:yes gene_type:complete
MMNQTTQHTFSMRDQLIIAQALVLGIQELEKVPAPFTEVSNILDMKYLLNESFAEMAHVAKMMVNETQRINTEREVN